MKNYDIIVIGGGGGAKLVTPPSKIGLKVAIIEKDRLGGTCLNRGCIPSKMLIHAADIANEIKDADRYDINVDKNLTVNFKKLLSRVNSEVTADSESIIEAYNKNPNIDFYHDTAHFISNHLIKVGDEKLSAPHIFIAVGARPAVPPIEGLKNTPYWTSADALRNTRQPKKLIVIGGGYIATELGHFYGGLGTEVHFLVRSKMIKNEDSEVIEEFEKEFSKKYKVHFGFSPTRVSHNGQIFTVKIKDKNGNESEIIGDALLVATGVRSNADTLNLENTSVEVDEKGYIKVDEYLRTNAKGVYALGDVIGRHLFRHSVNFEGEYLFRTLFQNPSDEPINYPPMPHAIFSNPQVSGVGKTEDELKNKGADYIVGLNHYKNSAMGSALRSDYGFVKLLFEKSSKKLIGAHIIGPEASNMIHMAIAYMNMNAILDDLLRTIYIHPALPEIFRNAARKAKAKFDEL